MTDDLGYEGLSCNGSLDYNTPNLDNLAAKGIRFTNCYSQPLCTPSRVKIMTGRYSFRNYEKFGLLSENEITFGKIMQGAGYNTSMVGKWQLGGNWETPYKFGFDEYCLTNGIMPKEKPEDYEGSRQRYWGSPVIVKNGEEYISDTKKFGPDIFNEYAVDFIMKKRNKPFFLYYPMMLTHNPFVPSPLTQGEDGKDGMTSEVRYFKDMVEYTDVLVGNIITALKKSNQIDNTIIMFTSDNGTGYPVRVTAASIDIRRVGASNGARNKEGTKTHQVLEKGEPPLESINKNVNCYEGSITSTTFGDIPGGKDLMNKRGTHVPFVSYWAKYEKDYDAFIHTANDLIDFSDFFATLTEFGGGKLPSDRKIDGISFAKRLKGKEKSKREYIFCHYWFFGRNPKLATDAIHDDEWKLYSNGKFFNIKDDPEEKNIIRLGKTNKLEREAYYNMAKFYKELRNIDIPITVAPSKTYKAD